MRLRRTMLRIVGRRIATPVTTSHWFAMTQNLPVVRHSEPVLTLAWESVPPASVGCCRTTGATISFHKQLDKYEFMWLQQDKICNFCNRTLVYIKNIFPPFFENSYVDFSTLSTGFSTEKTGKIPANHVSAGIFSARKDFLNNG